MARYDDLNTTGIAYATVVSIVVFLVIFLLLRAMTYGWVEGESDRKLAGAHYASADAAISAQKERVAVYGTTTVEIAPPEGEANEATSTTEERILIPVSRAGELLLDELASATDEEPEA